MLKIARDTLRIWLSIYVGKAYSSVPCNPKIEFHILINALNSFPFRNNPFPLDVNDDGDDNALDLLNLINRQNVLNPATGQMETRLKLADAGTIYFYDLSGDSYFTSLDMLIFINNWDGN